MLAEKNTNDAAKRILIIGLSNLPSDARILKFIKTFSRHFQVDSLAYEASGNEARHFQLNKISSGLVSFVYRHLLLLFRMYKRYNSFCYQSAALPDRHYDLIIAHDIDSMPLALKISQGSIPIWLDLHEYAPEEFNNSFLWRVLYQPYKKWLLATHLQKALYVSTVGKKIAELYIQNFGVSTVGVIENRANYVDLMPGKPSDKIKLIHHGVAMPERQLEKMIDVVTLLGSGYEMHFLLQCNNEKQLQYKKKLQELGDSTQVFFHDAIAPHEIPGFINQFDIGLFLLPPINTNWKYTLPNKLFEYIQARLVVAISPNPAMKSLVEQYEVGIVAKDYSAEALADGIKELDREKIQKIKEQSHKHAQSLSFDANKEKMINIAKDLIS